ncbi:MAG: hypothetical protein PWQ37_2916 [Candidatus Petromonas sp.]|jgi:nitroreductase|nr:hypothetical protein [Candidatus Petromonas sp.]
MNFLELVTNRQSVRKYLEKRVEREKIERCLEAARLSPSACNSQPWKFIVVDKPELREKVAKATFSKVVSFNRFALSAPVLVVVVSENRNLAAKFGGMVKNIPYYLIDIGIAAEHFCLQATEEGLGTCMIGWFKEKEIKDLLNVPNKNRIALVITLGYPEQSNIRKKQRKDLNTIMSYNKYS